MRYLASILGLCILSTILLAQGIGGKAGIGGTAGIGSGLPTTPTITFVSAASGVNTSGGTTCVLSPTFTSGQLVVAFISDEFDSTNVSGITLSVNDGTNTYTQFSTSPYTDATTFTKGAYWWSVPATGTPTVTFTASTSAGQINCFLVGYTSSSGWKGAPVDKEATANVASTTLAVCSSQTLLTSGTTGATAQATELEVGMFAISNSSTTVTWSAGSGFTQRNHDGVTVGSAQIEDAVTTTTGTYSATANVCVGATSLTLLGGSGIIVTLMPN